MKKFTSKQFRNYALLLPKKKFNFVIQSYSNFGKKEPAKKQTTTTTTTKTNAILKCLKHQGNL